MKGNIFGGFTPVEWESRFDPPFKKGDPSLKSFIFTLKNPHNVSAQRFGLKAERKDDGIRCNLYQIYNTRLAWSFASEFSILQFSSKCGTDFGHICALDNCNSNTANSM
jgi:hypothetical protein